MKTTAAVKRMSDTVIFVVLRSLWADVERNLRHGVETPASVSDYVANLTTEQKRRAL